MRWGLAGAGLYYYNTNDIFAEAENAAIDRLSESIHNVQDSELPTIEAIVAEKRARAAARAAEAAKRERAEAAALEAAQQAKDVAEGEVAPLIAEAVENTVAAVAGAPAEEESAPEEASIEALEEEAGQQGAFNPETGEINWDCPCLGGMAHGPCGPEFREAFSCFVYSKEEPKGMECIDKFKGMQDCFRQHPEMYASELEDDEVEEEIRAQEDAKAAARGDSSQDEAAFVAESAASEESQLPSSAPSADATTVGNLLTKDDADKSERK